MNNLSPKARDILMAGRAKDGPSAENRRRVRAGIVAATGVAFASSAAATGAAASMRALGTVKIGTTGLLAAKVGAGLAILGIAGGVIVPRTHASPGEAGSWGQNATLPKTNPGMRSDVAPRATAAPTATPALIQQTASSTPTPVSVPAFLAAPDSVSQTANVPLTTLPPAAPPAAIRVIPVEPNPGYKAGRSVIGSLPVTPADETSATASSVAAGDPTADKAGVPPSLATSSVDIEALLLRDAHTALFSGDPARALSVLDRHASEFPHGILSAERDAERVVALCAVGRTDESRAQAERFLHDHPRSPLAPRVRTTCERR